MATRKKTPVKRYPVTISDWITFLESNASHNVNLYVLMGTIIIALAVSVDNFDISNIATVSFTGLLVLFLLVIILRMVYAVERIRLYQRLSKKIMTGEITKPKQVLEEYKKFAP